MGDRVAKSRVRGASPAAQPSSSHLGCGACAHPLGTTADSNRRRSARRPSSGLLGAGPIGAPDRDGSRVLYSVGRAFFWPRAALVLPLSAPDRAASSRATPAGPTDVAFAFAQQMPDEHRELTGSRDSGDMLTAAGVPGLAGRTHATDPALALPPKPLRRACRAHAHGPAS